MPASQPPVLLWLIQPLTLMMRAPAGAPNETLAFESQLASPGPPVFRATIPSLTLSGFTGQWMYASAKPLLLAACHEWLIPSAWQASTWYVPARARVGRDHAVATAHTNVMRTRRITARTHFLRSTVR